MDHLTLFAHHHPWLLAALGVILALFVADEIDRRTRGYTIIDPHEAIRRINAGALIIDLRPRSAYEGGHITHALHLPAPELEDHLPGLLKKNPPSLVLYGKDAARIARRLHARDPHLSIAILHNELMAWKSEHLPLVRGKDPA